MAISLSLAVRTELRSIRSDIGAAARKMGLKAGEKIRAQLVKHPSIRPMFNTVGYNIGRFAAKDELLFSNYCTVADILAPIGRMIFPDYRAYSSRIKLITENYRLPFEVRLNLFEQLTSTQVKGILGAISPRDGELIQYIKTDRVIREAYFNAVHYGAIDPEGKNDPDQDAVTRERPGQLERELDTLTARVDEEISPEKVTVVEGSVVELDVKDLARAIIKPRKALTGPA